MHNSDASRCLADLERYRPLIRGLLPAIYDADDVLQDVYVAADQATIARQSPQSHAAWLRTVARNITVRRRRHESRRQCPSLSADPRSRQAEEPLAELEKIESRAIIRKAVQSMKPNYRHVIEQRFFGEKSFSQIAEDLTISEETVRTRYKRGMKQLKKDRQVRALA